VGPFLLAPLESLLLTPLFALAGRFTYHSPMLLATRAADGAGTPGGALELHTGTLFDYVTELDWARRGPATARVVLVEIVRGLLAIVAAVERGDLPPRPSSAPPRTSSATGRSSGSASASGRRRRSPG
jgi:hypothetical protein